MFTTWVLPRSQIALALLATGIFKVIWRALSTTRYVSVASIG